MNTSGSYTATTASLAFLNISPTHMGVRKPIPLKSIGTLSQNLKNFSSKSCLPHIHPLESSIEYIFPTPKLYSGPISAINASNCFSTSPSTSGSGAVTGSMTSVLPRSVFTISINTASGLSQKSIRLLQDVFIVNCCPLFGPPIISTVKRMGPFPLVISEDISVIYMCPNGFSIIFPYQLATSVSTSISLQSS